MEHVEVPVEVEGGSSSILPQTGIPQLHFFNENNQLTEVSPADLFLSLNLNLNCVKQGTT